MCGLTGIDGRLGRWDVKCMVGQVDCWPGRWIVNCMADQVESGAELGLINLT
jgi:hypothetical protein